MVSGSPKNHKLGKFLNIIRNIIGILILVILVYYVGTNNIFNSFKSINFLYFPIILVSYISSLLLSTLCISFLIKKKIPFNKLFRCYTLSWVYGLLLPGKLGEFSLVYFLKKERLSISTSLVVSFIDKLITFLLFSVITVIGVLLVFNFRQGINALILFLIIIVMTALAAKINLLSKIVPKKYKSYIKPFFNEYHHFFKNDKKRIYKNLYFTLVRWFVDGVSIFMIFLALGITVNIIYVLIINTMTALLSLIPLTANGLGIRQSAGVYTFSKLNINPAITVNMYLISLSFTYLIAFSLYSYYSFIQRGDAS